LYDQIKLLGATNTVNIVTGARLLTPGTLKQGDSSGVQVTLINSAANTTPAITGKFQDANAITIGEQSNVTAGTTTMTAFYTRGPGAPPATDNNLVLIEPLTVVDPNDGTDTN